LLQNFSAPEDAMSGALSSLPFRLGRLYVAMLLAGSSLVAASFNTLTDFSLSTNTATNTFSYWGTTSTDVANYNSAISLLPNLFPASCGSGTTCWDMTFSTDNLVLYNATGSDALFPNSLARNNQVTIYDREGITLVRFLAAATGMYNVSGFFEGNSNSPESTQEVIAVDGNVATAPLDLTGALAFGSMNSFNFNVSLNSGDTLDFLVAGVTTTADRNSLATGLDATISTGGSVSGVPEPSAYILLACGLCVLGMLPRKRQ
jgi:hypothetical protein